MGKAIKVVITREQKLLKLRSSRAGKNIGERAYYILLSASGKSIGEISAQLGRNPHTVRCWIKRYLRFGISGLIDKSSSGRPNQLREKVKEELNQFS